MQHIKEILPDKINVVTEDGDVIPHEGDFDNDYELSELEAPEPVVVKGASLKLGERALAIEAMMNYFNQQSKLKGIRSDVAKASLKYRYGSKSIEVTRGVERKTKVAGWTAQEALGSLSKTEDLIEAGFTPAEVRAIRRELYEDLKNTYGPGVGDYRSRQKATKKADRTAKKLS